jgi:hypothetical protein
MLFLSAVGACSISELFTFIQTTVGVQITGLPSCINTNGVDNNLALGGSNITVKCRYGYTNTGGPLTIVCTQANTWTPFPICVSTMTTAASSLQCPYTDGMLTFENGYLSNVDGFVIQNGNTATGNTRSFFFESVFCKQRSLFVLNEYFE